MTQNCILDGFKRDGCKACAAHCQHRIALEGLNGAGGRIAAAGLPAKYRHLTLNTSPARKDQAENYAALARYVESFATGTEKSAYLWSESPGTGKTTTAAALANEWIARQYIAALKRGEQPAQLLAYFLDVNAWQELYTGFTRPKIPEATAERNSRLYYRQMEYARTAPFAVLDDLGVRDASDGFRQDLHAVVNHRVTNGLPTVYTSNIPVLSPVPDSERLALNKPYDLKDVYDERLYDRIRDQCGVMHFKGTSKRGRR